MNAAELSRDIYLIVSASFVLGSLFRVVFDPQQSARPELRKRSDPSFVYLSDRNDIQRIYTSPSLLAGIYQPGCPQGVDMLHDCEPRHVRKGPNDLRSRFGPVPQKVE